MGERGEKQREEKILGEIEEKHTEGERGKRKKREKKLKNKRKETK
jgi:hypothetical protein